MGYEPIIFEHPLIQHKVSVIRDENTSSKDFREIVAEIAMLMCYEVTRDLPLEEKVIKTPMATMTAHFIAGRKLAIVPILRAGLGMVDGVLNLIPGARVGHIGLYRDPETNEAVEYYSKFPQDIGERDVILLDPMLATGNSAIDAVNQIKARGAGHIKFMCIIAARQGLNNFMEVHPDVQVYCAALDEDLDEHAYIIPGLGDAGDRIFGTK